MDVKQYSASEIETASKKLLRDALKILTRVVPGRDVTARVGKIMGGSILRPEKIRRPIALTAISYDEIGRIVATMPLADGCKITICDERISTYPPEVFAKFMKLATMRQQTYVPEQFDCDDFSITFAAAARQWHAKLRHVIAVEHGALAAATSDPDDAPGEDAERIGGAPVGMCHGTIGADSGMHAFNFWIAPDKTVVFLEPQTGERVNLEAGAIITMVYI